MTTINRKIAAHLESRLLKLGFERFTPKCLHPKSYAILRRKRQVVEFDVWNKYGICFCHLAGGINVDFKTNSEAIRQSSDIDIKFMIVQKITGVSEFGIGIGPHRLELHGSMEEKIAIAERAFSILWDEIEPESELIRLMMQQPKEFELKSACKGANYYRMMFFGAIQARDKTAMKSYYDAYCTELMTYEGGQEIIDIMHAELRAQNADA